ncbi:RdgB/HAM1 family non-canonical purine NTP pyrophosphatase [Anaeromyxobacter sp. Fw109-5]|uniref:dITP/XTP pyrophosphatase n=1 Tax=Anaeromyxobacter sp. (strain Fw109-5) TaxID=404589 RepID=IXTPA_ANADF|nr:RdgB/HAM1 family non-canonical purine NTP pyrophosphatase [Anaeromyxobacter sp. Fw109-5]A7HFW2.1 RecName: Full=dITP/XTP pyrophosphatase; AltName: Full=Non-canonical purine NTP pyrophosphatase; AltName: Full=Non-standard purine NTP pyrophosphatase; AltName: Full=Nucleoside-triphosphate diphosphatase; AltName: Full=Nucleoside-triphosphate pyrophosphatase; Short=NTPase [Anaeromyxobacter sp. Fw109-5]ABS27608.1 Ham1 family protein [Anaeromyxobacter sp. Fw109-5]
MDLLFASTNPGKLKELRRLVAGLPIRVVSPDELPRALPEVEEDGATFQANAEKKASTYARLAGMAALADDSGLAVDALGGAPGVRSARWSDEEPGPAPASPVCDLAEAAAAELGPVAGRGARDERNNDKLLRSLAGLPDERRGAQYEAVLAVARADGSLVASVAGVCRGRIGHARRGTGGFGYDPLFVPDGQGGRTMAELSAEEKDAISHRGDAFRRIRSLLERLAREGA